MTSERRALRGLAQRGIGKFEFAIVVALIGVLAAALLARLAQVEREAERLEVELTVRNIRVGLQLAVGERLMRGEEDRLAELLAMSPVRFLGRVPANYAERPDPSAKPGSWRYDPAARRLEYRPRQPEAFGGRTSLRWRLEAAAVRGGRLTGLRLAEEVP
jgi:hypothetical protein